MLSCKCYLILPYTEGEVKLKRSNVMGLFKNCFTYSCVDKRECVSYGKEINLTFDKDRLEHQIKDKASCLSIGNIKIHYVEVR